MLSGYSELGKGSVLIAGSKERFRKYYEPVLTEKGYNVILTESMNNLINSIEHDNDIDLLIVDYDLFNSNEIEVLKAIRSSKRELPIILNFDAPYYRENYMTWMADECLMEPVDADALVNLVNSLVHYHHSRWWGWSEQ